MQYKVRLRSAVVFGFAALVLVSGIFAAAFYSPLFSSLKIENEKEDGNEYEALLGQESYWHDRLTYPTGRFDQAWVRQAVAQDAQIQRGVPAGRQLSQDSRSESPLALDPNSFTALGPKPERMTGCAGCFDYGLTQGRVNSIVVDPTTTTPGSIVAYLASNGGGI